MKRKKRKTVMIVFIIVSIFLSACGKNREYGTEMEQKPEGPKAADLAVVNTDDVETEEEKTEQDSAEAESNGEIDSEDDSNQEQPELYTDEWIKENVEGIEISYHRYYSGQSDEDITQEDIDKISQLTDLQRLTISTIGEVDLSPLGNLTELRYLHINILSDNQADLSFLKQLVNLRELRLEGFASVPDLSFAREMPYLKVLSLDDVEDADLNCLVYNWILEVLRISGRNIRNPEGLTGLKCLERLFLCETMPMGDEDKRVILHMDSISGLEELDILWLEGIRIEDVSPLCDMENLTFIKLDNTDIEDIKSLKKLESLNDGDDLILEVIDEPKSGAEDYTSYSTSDGFLIQDKKALEKCMDDLQNHYPSGKVTLRIANEMADLDTSALAEMIWERDLETEWEVVPESLVFREGEDTVVPVKGTEYAVRVCFENSYYLDHVGNPLLYRPEESGTVPDCMQPFLSEEVRAAISEADIGKDEYLGLFVKQDVGAFHYFTYGFSSRDENNVGSCSHVLLWVLGERADGTHVSQVLEVPEDRIIGALWDTLRLRGEDLNQDGEEDLLIRTGLSRYCGFLWNGKNGKFEFFESLPDYITY